MIRKPLKVLVCLAILLTFATSPFAWANNGIRVAASRGVEADALSAEPALRPVTPNPHRSYVRAYVPRSPRKVLPPPPPFYGPPPPPANPLLSLFSLPGIPTGPFWTYAYLPRPMDKQFQFSARLWYAKFNSNTILWGTDGAGGPGTEIDLVTNLDLGKYKYIPEFEGRFHIRSNWAVRYSFMGMWYDENFIVPVGGDFYFGNVLYPAGTPIVTSFNRLIHRWDLVYDWFQAPHAISSIFAGYSLYDDKLAISSAAERRVRSRGFGLAFAGMSLQRVKRNLGGGGVASLNCKWSIQFLEDYFGWDGYAGCRIAVPLNCGRWGYLEGGWRWMDLKRDKPTDKDRIVWDGLQLSMGFTF